MSVKKPSIPKIGFLIDNIISLGKYQTLIWEGVTEAARTFGVHLFTFCGGTLDQSPVSPFEKWRNAVYNLVNPRELDGLVVASSVGTFVSPDRFIAFLQQFSSHIPVVSIGRPIESIPHVVEDNFWAIKNLVTHLIRHHHKKRIAFIRGLVDIPHIEKRYLSYRETLIEHGLNPDPDLVYIGNLMPESGREAIAVLMDEKGAKFDAIIAANDNMALGAVRELQRRGFAIPKDIAVVGHDDIDETEISDPPLTTIRSPLKQMGACAIELVFNLLHNKNPEKNIVLPADVILRDSCGCTHLHVTSPSIETSGEKSGVSGIQTERNTIISSVASRVIGIPGFQHIRKSLESVLKAFLEDFTCRKIAQVPACLFEIINSYPESTDNYSHWHIVISALQIETQGFFRDPKTLSFATALWNSAFFLISSLAYRQHKKQVIDNEKQYETLRSINPTLTASLDIKKLTENLIRSLPGLHIQDMCLFLYKETLSKKRSSLRTPQTLVLTAGYYQGHTLPLGTNRTRISAPTLLNELFHFFHAYQNAPLNLLLEPLHVRSESFGFIVYNADPQRNLILETLTGQISSVIMNSVLYQDQLAAEKKLKKTLLELETANKKLEVLSVIDELTGLYNRRGLFTFAEQYRMQGIRNASHFLLFFIDLDGLKKINDRFGHKEGDRAIRNAADILRQSFRKSDVIARIGGDEFVIIAPATPIRFATSIQRKIEENLKIFNEEKKSDYRLDLSIGYAEFNPQKEQTTEALLAQADQHLYANKNRKKNHIQRRSK